MHGHVRQLNLVVGHWVPHLRCMRPKCSDDCAEVWNVLFMYSSQWIILSGIITMAVAVPGVVPSMNAVAKCVPVVFHLDSRNCAPQCCCQECLLLFSILAEERSA